MGYHIILCTHLLRKEESWKAQQQSQRRENATKDNSDGRENHKVIWCVLIFRRLGGNHRLLYEQHHNNNIIMMINAHYMVCVYASSHHYHGSSIAPHLRVIHYSSRSHCWHWLGSSSLRRHPGRQEHWLTGWLLNGSHITSSGACVVQRTVVYRAFAQSAPLRQDVVPKNIAREIVSAVNVTWLDSR